MDYTWLLTLPLLFEIRNWLAPRRVKCGVEPQIYIPARGEDEALKKTAEYAVVLRDADDVCREPSCLLLKTTGKSAALEYAVSKSTAEYIALFDSDVYFTKEDAEALACAAGDGVATAYRVVKCRDFSTCLAAAVSDFGFLYMSWRRFIWGGAVGGRREVLARVYRGVSSHVSDDIYATERARELGVAIKYVHVAPRSDPPGRGALENIRWAFRQYAIAYRQGGLWTKLGILATAAWLATVLAHPKALAILYLWTLARRVVLREGSYLHYAAAALPAFVITAAATAASPFIKKIKWRDRSLELR